MSSTKSMSAAVVMGRETWCVPALRAIAVNILRSWRVAPEATENMALVISELVTNAVRHGEGPKVCVHLFYDNPTLCCRVSDDNVAAPTMRAPSPHADSGRGMELVDSLSTRWGTAHPQEITWGQKEVWVELTC